MSNTFGRILQLTTFGESHGAAIGGVLDGYPAGIAIDKAFVDAEVRKRATGQSHFSSSRKETDEIEFLSGIYNGKSLGTPIAFIVRNTNQRPADYDRLHYAYRPSHADYTYEAKYGIRDPRGGGRTSARETLARVVAGALAKMALQQKNIRIKAFTSAIGPIELNHDYTHYDLEQADANEMRCPDAETAAKMYDYLQQVKDGHDSAGGIVTCVVEGCPAGIGEPVYGKLQAALASAMLSIPSVKGFDYGGGFDMAHGRGSEMNDAFVLAHGEVHTKTNHSGGIQGGISNGEPIYFRVAFKPVASIAMPQTTLTVAHEPTIIEISGRHDVCVVPRAVAVVEAMAALVVLDGLLQHRATCL